MASHAGQTPFWILEPSKKEQLRVVEQIGVNEWPSCIIWKNRSLDPTWMIIPASQWLINIYTIYKPWNGHLEGEQARAT